MWDQNAPKQTLFQHTATTAAVGIVAGLTLNAPQASALTVEDWLEFMPPNERTAYVDGVVEGLAFARWIADDRDQTGMNCVLGWYYGDGNGQAYQIARDFFDQHPDQHIGTLMYALIREECGEQGE